MTERTGRVGFGVPADRASPGERGGLFAGPDQRCRIAVKVVAATAAVFVRIDFRWETPSSPARTRHPQRIQSP